MKRTVFLISLLLVCVVLLSSCSALGSGMSACVSCVDFANGGCASCADALGTFDDDTIDYAPGSSFDELERGDSVDLTAETVNIEKSFSPSNKKDGYINKVDLKVKVTGYDGDFTYFDAKIKVTWLYNEISEKNPRGINKTFETTIELNANGDGLYEYELGLQGCRDVKLVDFAVEFSGTATKK